AQYGMQTFDQSLLGLYREELITYETARDAATNPDDFDLKVKGIFSTGEMTWDTNSGGFVGNNAPPAGATNSKTSLKPPPAAAKPGWGSAGTGRRKGRRRGGGREGRQAGGFRAFGAQGMERT